jgi:integrase
LVDREHRPLALRVDGERVLAVRGDAPSSATRTARRMRHGQAPVDAVVATDPASADADCDNGSVLRGMCGSRRGDGDAAHRLARAASRLRRRIFEPLPARAWLHDIRSHDLRHICATLILTKGVHPTIVSEILGY